MEDGVSKSLSTSALLTVVLASGWSFFAFLRWSNSAASSLDALSPGWLTTIALVSCVITTLYRFVPADLQRHATWIQVRQPLAFIASINWLGFILIRSPELLAAVPAVLVFAATEAGIRIHAYWDGWRRDQASSPSLSSERDAATAPPKIAPEHLEQLLAKELGHGSLDESEPVAQPLQQGIQHQQRTGTDEGGNRFTAGEIFVHFSESDRARQVVIGFQPAFSSTPDVEIESEDGNVTAEVQNCTPSGMRLICKLDRAAAANTSTVIAFYVTESLASQPAGTQQAVGGPARTATILP